MECLKYFTCGYGEPSQHVHRFSNPKKDSKNTHPELLLELSLHKRSFGPKS